MRPYWVTWFLDQWPAEMQAGCFYHQKAARYPRLRVPADLMRFITR